MNLSYQVKYSICLPYCWSVSNSSFLFVKRKLVKEIKWYCNLFLSMFNICAKMAFCSIFNISQTQSCRRHVKIVTQTRTEINIKVWEISYECSVQQLIWFKHLLTCHVIKYSVTFIKNNIPMHKYVVRHEWIFFIWF